MEGDRPDVVATKLYGDSDLHWTFFLVNNWNNYYEWWKSNQEFEQYLNKYYSGQYLTAYNKTDIVGASNKFLLGETVSCLRNGVTIEGVVNEVQPNFARIGIEGGEFRGGEQVTGDVSGHSLTIKDQLESWTELHIFITETINQMFSQMVCLRNQSLMTNGKGTKRKEVLK